jgi:hypothetical protein
VPDEKDYELETLRRLFAVVHEKRKDPSRLKKILTWLGGGKVVKSTTETKPLNTPSALDPAPRLIIPARRG